MKMTYRIPQVNATYVPALLNAIKGNHTLIAGTTGCGKSTLEHAIMRGFLGTCLPGSEDNGRNVLFFLLDPKKVELSIYKTLPHTICYASDLYDIEQALMNIRLIINQRLYKMERKGIRKSNEAPIYVFIDELVDLVKSKRSKQIIEYLSDCISISRCCNIFFIICTQAPNRRILLPEIVLNCNCRIALFCNDAIESRQIIGTDDAARLPKHGVGIVRKDVDKYKVEIPLYSDDDIQTVIKGWTSQHPIYDAYIRWITRPKKSIF